MPWDGHIIWVITSVALWEETVLWRWSLDVFLADSNSKSGDGSRNNTFIPIAFDGHQQLDDAQKGT